MAHLVLFFQQSWRALKGNPIFPPWRTWKPKFWRRWLVPNFQGPMDSGSMPYLILWGVFGGMLALKMWMLALQERAARGLLMDPKAFLPMCLSLWSWLCGWVLWCFGCLLVGTTCPRICFLCWIASPKKYRHKIKGTLTLNDHFWEQLAVRLSYRAVLAFWWLLNPLSPGRTMGADAGHSMAPRKLNLIICWSYFHSKTSLSQFIDT